MTLASVMPRYRAPVLLPMIEPPSIETVGVPISPRPRPCDLADGDLAIPDDINNDGASGRRRRSEVADALAATIKVTLGVPGRVRA